MFTGPNTYDFSKGDAIVSFAKANGLRVHLDTPWFACINPELAEKFHGNRC